MQLRCPNCHTMFALNRETVQIAYEQIVRENQHHYDAHCPKCRRAVYVTRQQLEWFNPWLKSLSAQGDANVKAAPTELVLESQPARAAERVAESKPAKAATKAKSAAKPAKITKKSKPAKKAPPKKK